MLKFFARYLSVGVVNTLIHWLVFGLLYSLNCSQFLANFIAFCIAVTFSFFANACWTFNAPATGRCYGLYVLFMGGIAATLGYIADQMHTNAILTLVSFSLVSVLVGFLWSHFIIFRIKK
ncbi:MAG: Prophage bactoprenol-linked glucose translocase [Candidatus Erwinia impunctatus]|nr:Prophage bactoprenol-linked glucose translocase [Culicoides impunctatus]